MAKLLFEIIVLTLMIQTCIIDIVALINDSMLSVCKTLLKSIKKLLTFYYIAFTIDNVLDNDLNNYRVLPAVVAEWHTR